MSDRAHSRGGGLKSAYELALERLAAEGIERPDPGSLSDETRSRIAEVRRRAEAKLAELEILHRDRLARTLDPAKRREEEEGYQRERRRILDERDREIERLRQGGSG